MNLPIIENIITEEIKNTIPSKKDMRIKFITQSLNQYKDKSMYCISKLEIE